jgi:hypothetical protein
MSAYRCTDGELLPLILMQHGEQRVPNAAKLRYLVGEMKKGATTFRPVRVIDRGGLYEVFGVDDAYLACASMQAGFSHLPCKINCSMWGPLR